MLKRPMAVIGFSMLFTFLLITNITHKMTIALLIGAVVVFCCFILVKKLRKYLSVIFALFGVIVYTFSFVSAEKYYLNETKEMENEQTFIGVVCATPTDSDYAFSYVIKPEDKKYKIRYISQEDKFLCEGDYVKFIGKCETTEEDIDWFENAISSKVYFTIFESDTSSIQKLSGENWYYKNIGSVKLFFSQIVTKYLPGTSGAIAKAMTIGDKSELDRSMINNFNYCGTSHLLVISGLHVTIWSLGIVKLLYKFPKLRKKTPFIGLFCLFVYASITGFSISVLRASAMVGTALLARLFNRRADSINSIGLALIFILMVNSFAPFSTALWLSVFSTLGILVFSGSVKLWIREKTMDKWVSKIPLYNLIVTTVAISFSTMVFTLPVFIFKLKMVSVVSILTNFLMVDLAMIMMVCTVFGVIAHLLFLKPFAQLFFMIAGVIGRFLCFVAEKIGMAEWSTISLNHKYYEYFFILLVVGCLVIIITEKYKIHIVKHITVLLSVVFAIIAVYCTSYDYNTVSVEVCATEQNPIIIVNYKGESLLVGTQEKKDIDVITDLLNKHNQKRPDILVINETNEETIQEISNIYDTFGRVDTYFYGSSPQILSKNSQENMNVSSIREKVILNIKDDFITITSDEKHIAIIDCQNIENVFENIKEYDIIILCSDNSEKLSEGKNDFQLITLEEGERVSVCF